MSSFKMLSCKKKGSGAPLAQEPLGIGIGLPSSLGAYRLSKLKLGPVGLLLPSRATLVGHLTPSI